jgi:hypothetical protein
VFDISPSTVSKAVAPCSVYVSPTFRFIVWSPFNVIPGASVSVVVLGVVVLVSGVEVEIGGVGVVGDVLKIHHKTL